MNTITGGTSPFASQQIASSGASSTSDASTITSNDFLTLLVAQMKNQDPTSPTDPSQYMQQLVSVNSLQQLIDINKQLASSTSSTGSTSHG